MANLWSYYYAAGKWYIHHFKKIPRRSQLVDTFTVHFARGVISALFINGSLFSHIMCQVDVSPEPGLFFTRPFASDIKSFSAFRRDQHSLNWRTESYEALEAISACNLISETFFFANDSGLNGSSSTKVLMLMPWARGGKDRRDGDLVYKLVGVCKRNLQE